MGLSKKTVLIVDDEEDLTWSISRHLQRNGKFLDVKCVSSGDDAIDLLEQQKVDVLVSDIRMPGTDGLALLKKVSQNWPKTKVIIMTAYGSDILEEQVEQLGTTYYIEKPFELRYLRKLIFEALEISPRDIEGLIVNEHIKDIIAFNCQTRRTSQVTFKKGVKKGIVYLQKGEIVHAECGELEGEHALYNILDWERAYYHVMPNQLAKKRTIRRRWQSLLNATMID
ncbi:MAG: response regulator [Calditrichaeota bacterium]|nr:MAG: response regulator [Calditrichota bacterium]